MSFRFDDYPIAIDRLGWGPDELFRPINEHWSTLTILTFKLLFPVVGLRSYEPYLVVLLALHATATFLLFIYVRRHAGHSAALSACVVFALLGQGADNFFWATQINFAGSASAGLLALLLLEDSRPSTAAAASAALLASLMFSGVGLLYLVMIGVLGCTAMRRRRVVTVLAIPVLMYSVWFATYGAHVSNFQTSMLRHPEQLPRLPVVVAYGIVTAITEVYELPVLASIPIIAAALVAMRRGYLARHPEPEIILGASAAVITFYVLTGLERLTSLPTASRYIYAVAPLILVVTAMSLRSVPWRKVRPVAVVTLSLLTWINIGAINATAESLRAEAAARQDTLQFVALFGRVSGADGNATLSPRLLPAVTPTRYLLASGRLGSPFQNVTWAELRGRRSPWTELAAEAMFHPHLVLANSFAPAEACQKVKAKENDVVLPIDHDTTTILVGVTSGVRYRVSLRGYSAQGPPLSNLPISSATAPMRLSAPPNLAWDLHVATGANGVGVCYSNSTSNPASLSG